MIPKPQPNDYAPFAANYVAQITDGADVLQVLKESQQSTYDLFANMSEEQAMHAYAEGKWTLKEVLGHMIDTERVFSFRAFVFSREDVSLPGFDQDTYVLSTDFNSRSIKSLADEFKAVREATLFLFQSFSDEQLRRSGMASGYVVKVAALVYMTAGHELYHRNLINERYL